MTNRIGTRPLAFSRPPVIVSHATAIGKKKTTARRQAVLT